ncbi:AraC family transcriptional regulator [Pseudomonas sp. BW13M1]|uniref:AraC family transcriptional regulator n=1 Tax=Pseudomonas peradeniyensis TaxID=2745488 RepID=A0A923GES2_9PSED|nr:AraC family transcriptional regulator [Pseudomonas peradeniyensis]MBV4504299.1 AraC family transcriptional regulator [Pseudomonas peradeniyensis]
MRSIEHILWYLETVLDRDLDLTHVAGHFGLSPFALARQFAAATGWSVMRYVRARRLSRAAQTLCSGKREILEVALAAGYGSHEAFTRAFCDLFGVAPSRVRSGAHQPIALVEPLRMKALNFVPLAEPRFERRPDFCIAGLGERFTFERNEGIPGLWQAFDPFVGRVPGQVGDDTYGLYCNPGDDGSFEYIAGVEVHRVDDLPAHFHHFRLVARDYVVFRHLGHVSMIHQTVFTVFNQWLPASGHQAADAPEFEQYSADFDPVRGTGHVDLWIPLASR